LKREKGTLKKSEESSKTNPRRKQQVSTGMGQNHHFFRGVRKKKNSVRTLGIQDCQKACIKNLQKMKKLKQR